MLWRQKKDPKPRETVEAEAETYVRSWLGWKLRGLYQLISRAILCFYRQTSQNYQLIFGRTNSASIFRETAEKKAQNENWNILKLLKNIFQKLWPTLCGAMCVTRDENLSPFFPAAGRLLLYMYRAAHSTGSKQPYCAKTLRRQQPWLSHTKEKKSRYTENWRGFYRPEFIPVPTD